MQNSLFYINKTLVPKRGEEQVLEMYKSVTLEDDKVKVMNLEMKVTTHRILLEGKGQHAFLIEGQKINQVLISEHGLLWGKEYFVKLRTSDGKVKLQLNNYKEAELTINGMVKSKAWTKKLASTTSHQSQMYSGMFNKLQKEKQKIDENANKVGQSFFSFDSLFENLKQIKDVMKDIKASTGEVDGDSSEVNQILKDIGFVSVISKEEAGRDYYRHLAQDLYSICSGTLFKKYGGMVSLLDLFYFYNMKRQMQLVSPEQLYKACQQFEKFHFNAKLVIYPNNIKVIQSTSFDQEKDFHDHFSQYFNEYTSGHSADQLARKKGIPLAIVEIKLKKAARRGLLAVDSRIQGVKYYKNLFLTL